MLCGVLCRVQAHDESGHEGTIAERVSEAFTHSAECCISAVYERSLEDLVEEAGEHLAKCAEQGSTTGQVTPPSPPRSFCGKRVHTTWHEKAESSKSASRQYTPIPVRVAEKPSAW